ncbi:Hypothetical protein LEPBI_I1691 [Leptospira biflexa serovar Patoc strain 'Patoc 1 (Paris)']|uniref:Uncharacterized protein n=1 Tax=Leptospira biflexa serovar Patoc (strain Patoc 1 / ATCC 23582 / Paris) TaxID=456481 RepID=B0SRK2_LEPBP|nr:Hypothetical protein LEPBI_I1691 [Leptospira biflexa serovar Patoc strain 'Patoc 1 (Paris)']
MVLYWNSFLFLAAKEVRWDSDRFDDRTTGTVDQNLSSNTLAFDTIHRINNPKEVSYSFTSEPGYSSYFL